MSGDPPDRAHWSRFAAEWIAWTRTPDHDAFWAYRDAFRDFVGPGSGAALDVGCGEGRISRELKTLGYRPVATDPVAELVEAARQADSADTYVVAGINDLPLTDGCFALVVAYNVLMDVENVPAAVAEIRRVMRPDGRFVFSIVHPFADHGRFAGEDADAPFTITGTYFGRQHFEGTEERDGLTMHFAGWSQPLQDYAAALEAAGLVITAIREPQPSERSPFGRLAKWRRIPLFLWMTARPFG